MSEMSRAQAPAHKDLDPTDDMVPPAARSPRDPDAENFGPRDSDAAEDVGPQDFGAEDVNPQGINEQPDGTPLPTLPNSGGKASARPTQSSSDPMPDIAGEG